MTTLSPSSLLVAVFCGACGLPLVDAVSIETGIGPICRRKHGYESMQGDANWELARRLLGPVACLDMAEVGESRDWAHAVANRICHRVAVFQDGPDVARMVQGLAALGFRRMAARMAERLGAVTVEAEGDELVVRMSFDQSQRCELRSIPGRTWDRDAHVNRVPVSSRRELWAVLRAGLPGSLVSGPGGVAAL